MEFNHFLTSYMPDQKTGSKKHFKDRLVCKIKCSDHKVKLMNDLSLNLLNNKSFACGTSIIRIPFFLVLILVELISQLDLLNAQKHETKILNQILS